MAGATQVASLFATVGADLSPLKKGLSQAQGDIQHSGGRIKQALGGIATAAAGIAAAGVGGIAALGGGLAKLAMDAAPIEGIRNSFDNLTRSIGSGSRAILISLREASKGMITDTELMKSFNEAVMLAGDSMGKEFPKLMEIAQASAAATGQSMDFMLDSLVKGIGRASPMILDNLGLTIDLSEAYEKFAASLGIAAADMTKAQQQQAILNAVIEQGDEFIGKMGGQLGETQVGMAQLNTVIGNLKDTLGTALLPALSQVLTPLAEWAQERGPELQEWATTFGQWLANVGVPKMIEFAGQVVAFGKDAATAVGNAIQWLDDFQLSVAEMGEGVRTWFADKIPVAMEAVTQFINEHLLPAWTDFENFVRVYLLPIWEQLVLVIEKLGLIAEVLLVAFWNNKLKPTFVEWRDWLQNVWQEFQTLSDRTDQTSRVMNIVRGAIDAVKKALRGIHTWLLNVNNALDRFMHLGGQVQGLGGLVTGLFGGPSGGGGGGGGVGGEGGYYAPVRPDDLTPHGATQSTRVGSPTVVVVPLDRREFTQPNGELDYMVMGDRLTRERLY